MKKHHRKHPHIVLRWQPWSGGWWLMPQPDGAVCASVMPWGGAWRGEAYRDADFKTAAVAQSVATEQVEAFITAHAQEMFGVAGVKFETL